MSALWIEDIHTIQKNDPAAHGFWETFFTSNGAKALRMHRRAHRLDKCGFRFWARLVSAHCRNATGIDIHPRAVIGRRCFIDHGVGIVIGETAVVGDDVLIYQGVTLGGTGKEEGKRHPTIEDRVLLSAGAKVLGNIVVHHDSRIGAGSVVLKDVAPHCTVVGIPGRVVKMGNIRVEDVDQVSIPDPILNQIHCLTHRIEQLESSESNEE